MPRAAASWGLIQTGSRPATLLLLAEVAVVQLAVEAVAGLVGNHVQGVAGCLVGAEPLDGLHPSGMAGAVVVAEAVDGLGEEFDLAGGRPQGVSGWGRRGRA